jgi:DNA-binding transcriptional LysR family regulator
MELYQLEYFMEAARQRSFTRAAARLHLAQAALSEQIRKLEFELGTPLFNRGRRETVLTSAGETLRVHAESLLEHAETAKRAVRDLVGLRGGRPKSSRYFANVIRSSNWLCMKAHPKR